MSALFSKKNREVLLTPLGLNNPVTVQVLGICSALAVTAQLAGTGYRDGSFRNHYYSLLKLRYLLVA